MTSTFPRKRPALVEAVRDLAAVVVRPRRTMRRILDRPRDRMIIPLVVLAVIAGVAGDLDPEGLSQAGESIAPPLLALLIFGAIVLITLIGVGCLYLLSWIAFVIGRFFEGLADVRAVRSALAWGMAPSIWSLLYRIPALLLLPAGANPGASTLRIGDGLVISPGRLASGCGISLVFLLLEFLIAAWSFVIVSNTVAEAEGFSAWRGFATVILTLASPAIIMIAAVLAIRL